jgi:REP element-mobilizing transposase RayT
MELKHRNSQKRIYFEDAEYFVTSNTFNWYPYFKEPIFCDLFVENLRLCKKLRGFVLYAWFLGYDHFHLLLRPSDDFNYSKIMQFLKRTISRNINFVMGYHKYDEYYKYDKSIPEGGIDQSRLQGIGNYFPDDDQSRLQGIGNYFPDDDQSRLRMEIIHEFVFKKYILKFRFKIKYQNKNPYFRFVWHESFNDHYIRNDDDFGYHMGYIAYNPIKHNMPNDWPYVFTNPKYEELIDQIKL